LRLAPALDGNELRQLPIPVLKLHQRRKVAALLLYRLDA
jgi:hypothetical protein